MYSKPAPLKNGVTSGCGVRRLFTPAQKARIVAESFVAGASVPEVARRHDLLPHQLYVWRTLAQKGPCTVGVPRFVSAVVDSVAASVPSPMSSAVPDESVSIEFGGCVVRVSGRVDDQRLTRVLLAVKAAL